ncbi:MAG TPA: DUF481 domain-containing protein [Chitinophagaceae bacterium]|nr:DUF481 domain-containing protein [Chitinophagaceae bacterium]
MPHFSKLTILAILLLFSSELVFGQELKDTIIMNNGMILSGEMKNLKSGKIEFDIDNISIVKVKFDKIKLIKAVSHAYRIETSDRKIYYGTIRRGDQPGTLKIESKDTTVTIPLNSVAYMTSFDNKTFRTISGYVSSGFNYARSSNSGRFNFDGALKLQTKRTYSELISSMFISQTDTSWIRDRESLALNTYYVLNPWISLGGNLKYQRNYELGLARRFQEGLGLMVNLLKHNNFQMRALSGLVINQEKSTDGVVFPTQVEIPVNFYLEFFRFSDPNISITTSQSAYFSITDAGRVRWDGDTRISWEIIDDLAFSLQFYHNFDNRPPSGHDRNWDYGTVVGLKYEF